MLNYNDYHRIADAVYESLNIPDDMYLKLNKESVKAFTTQYMNDDKYIESLVDSALEQFDTTGNSSGEIFDLRQNAIDEIFWKLDDIVNAYYEHQHQITLQAYRSILQILDNNVIENVVSIDSEYEPADPDVGLYDEERKITFKLSNGSEIVFNVTIIEEE